MTCPECNEPNPSRVARVSNLLLSFAVDDGIDQELREIDIPVPLGEVRLDEVDTVLRKALANAIRTLKERTCGA